MAFPSVILASMVFSLSQQVGPNSSAPVVDGFTKDESVQFIKYPYNANPTDNLRIARTVFNGECICQLLIDSKGKPTKTIYVSGSKQIFREYQDQISRSIVGRNTPNTNEDWETYLRIKFFSSVIPGKTSSDTRYIFLTRIKK